MSTYNYTPGLGNAASYQSSGKPFTTGSIQGANGAVVEITFPAVTSWVQVTKAGGGFCNVAWSAAGLNSGNTGTNNFFQLSSSATSLSNTESRVLEVKVTRIYLSGSTDIGAAGVGINAGLTGIPPGQLDTVSGSVVQLGGNGIQGVNWSGSAGVG